jgi:hypothetical protein
MNIACSPYWAKKTPPIKSSSRTLDITEAAKKRDHSTAIQQVKDKEAQLSGSKTGEFERKKADGTPFVSIKKETVAIAVPK